MWGQKNLCLNDQCEQSIIVLDLLMHGIMRLTPNILALYGEIHLWPA